MRSEDVAYPPPRGTSFTGGAPGMLARSTAPRFVSGRLLDRPASKQRTPRTRKQQTPRTPHAQTGAACVTIR
jgi:hypothetical protein